MLLRYGGENYRSISEYQEILLTSSEAAGDDDSLIKSDGIRDCVLPIIELYGGNSSGKTNLLMVLRYIVNKILLSSKGDTDRINVSTFKLDEAFKEKKSTFDVDFICNDVHYHYGFAIRNNEIAEEWLYQISYGARKSTTTLLYRDVDADNEYYFGKSLKGNNKNIASVTPKGTLFLSQAAKHGHDILGKIYDYFATNYEFRFNVDLNEISIGEIIVENDLAGEISEFLSLVDVGAVKLDVEGKLFDEKKISMLRGINNVMRDFMVAHGEAKSFDGDSLDEYLNEAKEYNIKITRKNAQNNDVDFSFDQESLGTKALISFLASALQVLRNGGVFVVDEVESSLHTLLTLKLVELFASRKTNPNGAQIVFSTHETQLMTFKGVRRDEIWLTEKCQDGSTRVASLEEFSIDKRSNWQKGYIEGRFGAIPILGYIDNHRLFGE